MLPAPASPFSYAKMPTEVATALRKQAAIIRERVKATTSAIIDIGQDLLAVKQKLEHGQFSEWVLAECGFSIRTAENYIRAAEFAEGKNATVALLPPASVYKLAAKSAPPEIVQAVIDRVKGGVRVSAKDIDAAFKEATHQKRQTERKANEAVRRSRKSKRTLAQEEARRRAEELRRKKEDERLRLAALSIIDTIGEKHAEFLVQSLCKADGWQVLEHLRREVNKTDRVAVEATGTMMMGR